AVPARGGRSPLGPRDSWLLVPRPSSAQAAPAIAFAAVGQSGPFPGQRSSTSPSPAAPRQTVVVGSNASFGQAVPVPVQLSATSQIPAEARHSVPALPAGC